ncbi:MAG: histidinol-phosphate transaminase, partial [Waddliaceae bacterium]
MSNSRENYLRLDSNENLWGPSPRALEALRNLSGATISSYPHTDEFIEALSESLDLPKESLLLTNGSDEGLEFIISESVKPDEEVIIPEPSFSMFDILCDRVGARILKVPYGENYAFPEQELGDAISDRTKLVIIANPNNPTGTLATRKQLETLIVRFPKTTFLLDEAYGEFSGINNMELVKRYSNVIITRTFSKAYGLAGLRLGYVVSQPENISRLTGVMPYNVNQAAIAAGVASLKDTLYLERYVLAVRDARNKLQAALRQMGYTVFLSEANFLLVDFGPEASAIARKLKERGVLVRDFSQGRSTQNCLRVTVGTENEVDAFLISLEAILSSPDAFLFDMDGVLIDESQSYRLCIKKTVESFLKKEVSLQEIDALKKRGGVNNDYDCVEALLKQYELTVDRSQMIRTFQSYYFGECVQNERWIFPLSLLKR